MRETFVSLESPQPIQSSTIWSIVHPVNHVGNKIDRKGLDGWKKTWPDIRGIHLLFIRLASFNTSFSFVILNPQKHTLNFEKSCVHFTLFTLLQTLYILLSYFQLNICQACFYNRRPLIYLLINLHVTLPFYNKQLEKENFIQHSHHEQAQ